MDAPRSADGRALSAETAWTPPQLEGPFESAFRSSVLEEFVAGYTAPDVLTELVQNEYDAHGKELEVYFGPEYLAITGNGRGVDDEGGSG